LSTVVHVLSGYVAGEARALFAAPIHPGQKTISSMSVFNATFEWKSHPIAVLSKVPMSRTRTLLLFWMLAVPAFSSPEPIHQEEIKLRAYGVPSNAGNSMASLIGLEVMDAFRTKFPHIDPISSEGLMIPGRTMDVLPLMQIAGDIAPDTIYVNFRQSDTYIRSKFLYPLDKYIERLAGTDIPGGHLLSLEEYLGRLREGALYDEELKDRVPEQCWKVIRRRCPYKSECHHLDKWGETAAETHYHTWSYPIGALVMGLFYRWDYFAEADMPQRAPETMDELLEWSRKLHNPAANRYGLMLNGSELSWTTLSFLYSMGGLLVDQNENGEWHNVFDSDEAVEAYFYVARLFHEPFENEYGKFTTSIYLKSAGSKNDNDYFSMFFSYLDLRFFGQNDPNKWAFGPVPLGPTGKRGSEFNSRMLGIYAGLEDDEPRREAAWEYIRFNDGKEARNITTRFMVENGFGHYVRPPLLEAAGFPEYIRRVPEGWEESFQIALKNGVPEPYGKNCQQVYTYASKAIDQIRTDNEVRDAITEGNEQRAKERVREILIGGVERSDRKMLNILSPEETRFRSRVSAVVAGSIVIIFVLVFRRVFKTFAAAQQHVTLFQDEKRKGEWQFVRFWKAYLIMLPAIGLVAIWAYYPLGRGSIMAFQEYNVRGFTEWVGMSNFANILFDMEFWYSMWISFKYSLLFMLFGFVTPIVLAFLLTEVPRGKVIFRTIYYLPAVLSGVVVIFLWKGFYGSHGLISTIVNFVIGVMNYLPGVAMDPVSHAWLDQPQWALIFCRLPSIWAGMGPGCLIYLAALKTVPDDLYEAADVDGAGFLGKVFHVAIPSIKALIFINFIGVMIATMKSGGEFMLAMTGGGPYTPYGETEVVGLHIFWEAFTFLRFGTAVSMAWILGSFLIGFTVLQLQRLSRMEFRTADSAKND
jgi:ABC-type sugar transport system permease subunit